MKALAALLLALALGGCAVASPPQVVRCEGCLITETVPPPSTAAPSEVQP